MNFSQKSFLNSIYCYFHQYDIFQKYIEGNEDVDFKDEVGKTPLMHVAGGFDNWEMFDALVSAGADINKEDNQGTNVLTYCLLGHNPNKGNAEYAISQGADVNHLDKKGNSVLHKIIASDKKTKPQIVRLLIIVGADIEKNNRGDSLLKLSVEQKDTETVKILIKESVYVNEHTRSENWSFNTSLIMPKSGICDLKILKILIGAGIDVQYKNKYGETALSYAMNRITEKTRGHAIVFNTVTKTEIEIVKLLIENGVDTNIAQVEELNAIKRKIEMHCFI